MLKKRLYVALALIVFILLCSFVMTFILNQRFHPGSAFFDFYIDYLFFSNLPFFIVGSMMIIGEKGFFNVFIYSTNKVRSVVSEKYRYTLKNSESLESNEITDFLKNKYLYKKHTYEYTYSIFLSSSTILVGIFIFINLFY